MRALAILALVALAAGCSEDAGSEANNQAAAIPGQREARIGPVGLHYDSTKLAITPVQIKLPPDEKREVRGMKLVSREREPLLMKASCGGQKGKVCMPEAEGGLTLTVLNQAFPELSGPIPRTRPVTVAGLQGVTWEGRFGGTPATFTLLPVEQQTLMMIRQADGEGGPDAATLDAVVSTFKFGEPEPEKGRR
jgi:hypothetical protein